MAPPALTVTEPQITDRPDQPLTLCGPGPVNYWPSVAAVLAKPVLVPGLDHYHEVIEDIKAGLRYVFQTKTHLLMAMSGSGHTGMETIISNLVAPGETLLIASRGIWDERAFIMAKRYGIKPVVHRTDMTGTFSLSELETALRKTRPAALFITHGDSSTGSVQNMAGIGAACHKYGTLLLVDTVVSLVAEPFYMDEWGVDAVYTSTQKALSGPAGISPVAFSALAEKKIKNRKHDPPFYFDIKPIANQWDCYGDTRFYHHTMSPPLLWALRCCLQEAVKETLPVSWARHSAATRRFHESLQTLPFKFMITKPEDRLLTVTTLIPPEGTDIPAFNKYVREKHNIVIFGGLGPTAGKVLRVGLMGVNGTTQVADAVADAITDALRASKTSKL